MSHCFSISGLMKEIDEEFGSNGNGHIEAASLEVI